MSYFVNIQSVAMCNVSLYRQKECRCEISNNKILKGEIFGRVDGVSGITSGGSHGKMLK